MEGGPEGVGSAADSAARVSEPAVEVGSEFGLVVAVESAKAVPAGDPVAPGAEAADPTAGENDPSGVADVPDPVVDSASVGYDSVGGACNGGEPSSCYL